MQNHICQGADKLGLFKSTIHIPRKPSTFPQFEIFAVLFVYKYKQSPFSEVLETCTHMLKNVNFSILCQGSDRKENLKEHGKSCIGIIYEKYCVSHILWHN